MKNQAAAFLARHDMHYEQMPFGELMDRFSDEMARGLAGESSSLFMLPTYTGIHGEPARYESVLVMDAGKIALEGTPREVFRRVEEVRSLGLDVPETVWLRDALVTGGMQLKNDPMTMKETADAICQSLLNN